MPVAGFLLRPGRLDEDTTLKILLAAWHAAGAASREAARDLESIVRDTAENLRAGDRVVGGPTLEEYAPGLVRLLCKWWDWERREAEAMEEKEERPTQAQLLVRCAASGELFHTPAEEAYASVPIATSARRIRSSPRASGAGLCVHSSISATVPPTKKVLQNGGIRPGR
jgi:hypothetical protein